MTLDFTVSVLITIMAAATPLLFAAIGELVVEKSGVLNLGIEGMMLGGAVAAFAVGVTTGSGILGVIAGTVAGALMAFAFGLVHGFGFAGVLADLGLPGGSLLAALAGFNFGVEVGQLAIVAAVLAATYWLRRSALYGRLALPLGSGAVAAVGTLWLLERLLDLDLPLV